MVTVIMEKGEKMADFIDRKAAMNVVGLTTDAINFNPKYVDAQGNELVAVVRCKDCKYMTEHYDIDGNVPCLCDMDIGSGWVRQETLGICVLSAKAKRMYQLAMANQLYGSIVLTAERRWTRWKNDRSRKMVRNSRSNAVVFRISTRAL